MARKPARQSKTRKRGRAATKARLRKRSAAPKRRSARPPAKARKRQPRPAKGVSGRAKTAAKRRLAAKAGRSGAKAGGRGRESTLAQTPNTGRSVRGRTNPMPTKRSTGTPSGAGDSRRIPSLERERKRLREVEEALVGPPSSLNMDRHGSAVRTGRAVLRHAKHEHTETSPAMTGGDVDADWEDAYAVGDEAPGGDNPTPDQDRVDDIGRALGIEYQDNEELKAADKITQRDKHRWELDPASAEDYKEHEE
jgi:hypothetical protein